MLEFGLTLHGRIPIQLTEALQLYCWRKRYLAAQRNSQCREDGHINCNHIIATARLTLATLKLIVSLSSIKSIKFRPRKRGKLFTTEEYVALTRTKKQIVEKIKKEIEVRNEFVILDYLSSEIEPSRKRTTSF